MITKHNFISSGSWMIIVILLLAVISPVAGFAAPPQQTSLCTEEYVVQANDWLSKIADKYYGNTLAYPAISTATSQQHAVDPSFAEITNPDLIEIGWKICIPTVDAVETLLAASNNTIIVTDALNRQITFSSPPQRIVVAGKSVIMLADALYMFPEAKERSVSLPTGGQTVPEFLAMIDPSPDQKISLESNAGPEQIAAATPDVVVLKSFMAEKLGTPLEQLGIPVIYINLETPEQYTRDITILGQLLGNQNRARQILDFYQQRVIQVEQYMSGVTAESKPKVLVLQYTNKGGEVAFNVAPVDWIQTTLVKIAGGTPVWTEASIGGGWTIINFEQIAAWNPDQIYVISYLDDPEQVIANLKANPQWQALNAVKTNQLYGFAKDFYSWDQPDSHWILGLLWLTTKIHPDSTAQINMQQEINQFYINLYGLDQATIDAKITPILKGLK